MVRRAVSADAREVTRLRRLMFASMGLDSHGSDWEPACVAFFEQHFGTAENPRLWLDHRNIDSLDFRVYRVNDPQRFFTQLSDPHQLGEDEREQVATNISTRRSLLERIRAVKVWAYSGIRNYFREQLKQNTRKTFNQKFRDTESPKRVPLNVADYPRVPL